ncbi:hypothetical protein ColLi_12320 [Colletotrichum liriopes]|uniref:Vegetative cell wall protein gp1 n=1 Tax=Colletotrichum liriopes TaxID=708192 RepID=A0AA37GYR7_9PEZI|nr:hypothetical protein ColLi_12320 [Colletotrichum liriopes]
MANYSSLYTGSIPVDARNYDWDRYMSGTPTPFPWGSSSYYYPGSAPSRWEPARTSATPAAASANSVPVRRRRRLASTPHGESGENDIIDLNGYPYVLPPQSSRQGTKGQYSVQDTYYLEGAGRSYPTQYYYPAPSVFASIERNAQYCRPRPTRPATETHTRRSSTSVPQQPPTTRTSSSPTKKPLRARLATGSDANKHRIPPGYSLKNWDPTEKPILLLGSVFDSNSLGKWVYDWTVYHHGPFTPISDIAGDLWLLLIQLAGKVKHAEEVVVRIRSPGSQNLVDDFLRKLLKACESPMLKTASKKGDTQLGNNAGVEFVETLFGRDRELEMTERLMQEIRLFNLQFDICMDTLRNFTHQTDLNPHQINGRSCPLHEQQSVDYCTAKHSMTD